jgi:3',5'-cyclic-AMP phosphodiesterase
MKTTTRRQSLKLAALSAASFTLPSRLNGATKPLDQALKLGVITDIHIGYVPKASDRLATFLEAMKSEKPDALLQLGDFAFPRKENQADAERFNAAHENVFHVIGNHDIRDHGLTRKDCLKFWKMPAPYYTKVVSGLRIIVLDGNEPGSPTHASHGGYPSYIGKAQQEWLEKQLQESMEPVLILSHQPIAGILELDNAKEIRDLLATYHEKILLCLNGHSHVDQHIEDRKVNYLHINSASYYWLGGKVRKAEYKDPLFATITIDPDASTITITGRKTTWSNGTPEDVNYFSGKRTDWRQFVKPEISARNFKR